MDPLDLADPIRLVILLLPERYRAPAAVLISTLVTTQLIAAGIIARLPLSARQHPRWGWAVRAAHWYSVLRLRDEKGTVKAIGGDVAPRVTPAPTRADEVALSRETIAPPAPIAPLRGTTLTGREGERGSASVRSLLALALLTALLGACPNWQRPACTTPGAYSCVSDQPAWCSTTHELTPIGDEPCAAQGRVCGLRADGRAGCLRAVDGGAR